MNKKLAVIAIMSSLFDSATQSADFFPAFTNQTVAVAIPTNTPGYMIDPAFQSGSNAVYILKGQAFTNYTAGQIQTLSQGFSGTSDMTTPWRTLTQLMAAYSQGANSNQVCSLYSADSQAFLSSIYGNSLTTSNYTAFAGSITNMSVVLGYGVATNSYFAVTEIWCTGAPAPDTLPFYFVVSNGLYYVSSLNGLQPRESNIGCFLNTNTISAMLQ